MQQPLRQALQPLATACPATRRPSAPSRRRAASLGRHDGTSSKPALTLARHLPQRYMIMHLLHYLHVGQLQALQPSQGEGHCGRSTGSSAATCRIRLLLIKVARSARRAAVRVLAGCARRGPVLAQLWTSFEDERRNSGGDHTGRSCQVSMATVLRVAHWQNPPSDLPVGAWAPTARRPDPGTAQLSASAAERVTPPPRVGELPAPTLLVP
jgi:hypothetical protein